MLHGPRRWTGEISYAGTVRGMPSDCRRCWPPSALERGAGLTDAAVVARAQQALADAAAMMS
jgi:hypothetical protein